MSPVRAGPLLGLNVTAGLTLHCYVDGSFVQVLVNNRTALTAVVQPSQQTAGEVSILGWNQAAWGAANISLWKLSSIIREHL